MPINKTSQISTKNGDKGESRNFVNQAFSKDDILFELLGSIDELSSFLGLFYHHHELEVIKMIQRSLQDIMSLIATDPNHVLYQKLKPFDPAQTEMLESLMGVILERHPLEPVFTLPGSETSKAGAYCDVARAVARKAERRFVAFLHETGRTDLEGPLSYLNRLSDYLFVLARSFA